MLFRSVLDGQRAQDGVEGVGLQRERLLVQYLQYPAAVFSEFARVLDADGVLVVSFTNRMFPTKAVRAWRMASMAGRESLVRSSVDATDAFEAVRVVRDRPESDPFRAVVARR